MLQFTHLSIENLIVSSTCEGIYGSCSALLSSSSGCYSDGVLSPGLKVCQSGGGYIFRYCQLEQEAAIKHIFNGISLQLWVLHNQRSQTSLYLNEHHYCLCTVCSLLVSWKRHLGLCGVICATLYSLLIIISDFICVILYLICDARGRCVGDLVVVDGALNHAPHQSDGVVCRGRHSEIHGQIET